MAAPLTAQPSWSRGERNSSPCPVRGALATAPVPASLKRTSSRASRARKTSAAVSTVAGQVGYVQVDEVQNCLSCCPGVRCCSGL